ncbi:MAG TPA: transglutaminase-like domain-containing protein, partial [Bacteroidales bacterium]|nr:transglutaminase-like domain-containing protein [Bacteroidales bacterium]
MKHLFLVLIMAALVLVSCHRQEPQQTHDYYARVDKDFKQVEKLTQNRSSQLYSVFSEELSLDEKKYLKFLFAYMPLSDLADNDGKFFLAQVRTALEARAYFSWGKQIPDDIFRHFVLPYRVNNEYPDSARQVFFNELKPRVAPLSMYDAALEVNHWCHEKLNYRGTDERTISPLDAMRSTFGRCGEESTFAVTALRSVGIPARQVYTPRWAHCDDNHAWVEVWVDGKWYFMGACEPEAKLNKGWFEAPVLRAMLVHTRVFGRYNSNSNVMMEHSNHAIINVIDT